MWALGAGVGEQQCSAVLVRAGSGAQPCRPAAARRGQEAGSCARAVLSAAASCGVGCRGWQREQPDFEKCGVIYLPFRESVAVGLELSAVGEDAARSHHQPRTPQMFNWISVFSSKKKKTSMWIYKFLHAYGLCLHLVHTATKWNIYCAVWVDKQFIPTLFFGVKIRMIYSVYPYWAGHNCPN